MREANGGAMLFYIFIPVIILFIVFVAFVMNYAAAYRAANYVVTAIESCQAEDSTGNCAHTSRGQIAADIKSKYHYLDEVEYICKGNSRGAVYQVSLNVTMELPIVGKVGVFKVKAETKTMYGVTC